MAEPLPVQIEPIQQPNPAAVGAEAAIVYDTGGDPTALDRIHIDFYTSGGLEQATIGVILEAGKYQPSHPAKSDPGHGDFFRGPSAQVSSDFFEDEVSTPVIEVIFIWSDVASFFWWSSPFSETDGVITPRLPPEDFFGATGTPGGDDFFSGAATGAAASSWGGGTWGGGSTWL